jgi:hypothetical protein
MTPRDEEILRHLARHRLSIRPVLQRLFFKSPDAVGNVLARLMKAGLLESSKFPDGYSYYQLTDEGAKALGLPETPRVRDEHGAHAALASLWFCSMDEHRRLLLTVAEEVELLGGNDPGAVHCLQPAGEWSVLHELYVPGPGTDEENVIDRLRKRIEKRRSDPRMRDWVTSRNLGFAVLVEKEERRQTLKNRIGKAELRRFTSVVVELAPGPATLRGFLHDGNGRSHGS